MSWGRLIIGTVIAVIDAASALRTDRTGAGGHQHLVIRRPDGLVALDVEEVGGLVPVGSGTWHQVPAMASDLAAVGVEALVDTGDRLITVLLKPLEGINL